MNIYIYIYIYIYIFFLFARLHVAAIDRMRANIFSIIQEIYIIELTE